MSAASTVIQLRRRGKTYAHDPVFFTKDQIRVGTVLVHVGRLDPSAWEVVRIAHTNIREVRHWVDTVESFADRVYLKRSNGGITSPLRVLGFGYLCYSAVWRVG